jgi:acetoin utilization deacetylase AcuC-like enzyme
MLVVYSEHDLHGKGHTGSAGNAPEERKRLVQKALRLSQKCTFQIVNSPANLLEPLAGLVHDAGMLDFLETAWDRWSVEWRKKPNEHLKGVFCPLDSDSSSVHPPPLIPGFFAPREVGQKPSSGILGQSCFYAMDKETPIHESTLSSLKWDLAVTQEATRRVVSQSARIAYAQITHPGHHAGSTSYGGFCFINHAAIAVKLFQQASYRRIAVVDVDYHAGNGTMSIFWNDPTVFFASLHGNPENEYPFNAGYADQVGGDAATGLTMNVPLAGGTGWPEYKQALQFVVNRIKEFKAEALVVSLGVDTLRDDPVALPACRFSLDPSDYKEMGRMLLYEDLCLPTVVIQEGGYKLDDVPLAITAFLTGSLVDKRSFL